MNFKKSVVIFLKALYDTASLTKSLLNLIKVISKANTTIFCPDLYFYSNQLWILMIDQCPKKQKRT